MRICRPAAVLLCFASICGCSDGGEDAASEDLTAKPGPAAWCTETTGGKPSAACKTEAKVGERFTELRGDPERLRAFLASVPKGGDLHSHLSGAVETEALVGWAAEDGLCVDKKTLIAAGCKDSHGAPSPGLVPVSAVPLSDLVRAWSMEGFSGSVAEGHDHFFAAFAAFRAVTPSRSADMLANVTSKAAGQRELYLELMTSLGVSGGGKIATAHMTAGGAWDAAYLETKRLEITEDPKFAANLASARKSLDALLAERSTIQRCGADDADPGCGVEVRFVVQVVRDATRESVFGQLVHAFELGAIDPRVVGLNLALAEDSAASLTNYDDDMRALDALHATYGDGSVHVALHAGELVPELLAKTPEAQQHLTFHVRHAVEVGHAERIGHGVDILTESGEGQTSEELRAEMADRHVLVELCLGSNEEILGVAGPEHPMAAYLQSQVPLAVATDDEGVSRSSMTEELARAVEYQSLDYRTLKAMLRNSLEYSFLPGASLWRERGGFALPDACAGKKGSSAGCKALAKGSERAALQWKLEEQLATFERGVVAAK